MIIGARALVYERGIEPSLWHICCNGGDTRISGVPVLCGIIIQSVGDNVYIDGDTIEQRHDIVCSVCIEKARLHPLAEEEDV